MTHRVYRPAVFGLEQGQLGARVRPLAAGEDPHLRGPSFELIPGGIFAQQAGQLGDMRFFDPALAVPAAQVAARLISTPLADLTAGIDGDLPGCRRNGSDRGPLASAGFPADGVDDLVAAPGGQLVQAGDQVVAGAGAIAGDPSAAAGTKAAAP